MKVEKKQLARELRKKGFSINDIYSKLGVSKGSVSLWVRDVKLTERQKQQLTAKGQSKAVVEKRRVTRLARENKRRQEIVDEARKNIGNISKNDLFLVGIALYWGEGSKTRRGIVELANSDPRLIKVMMAFFRKVCDVPEGKFRGHIHLHPHLDSKKAELYWHKITAIPRGQFFKTSQQHNKASKGKKDSLPHGTFSIYVCNTELFLKIKGWMEGLHNQIT